MVVKLGLTSGSVSEADKEVQSLTREKRSVNGAYGKFPIAPDQLGGSLIWKNCRGRHDDGPTLDEASVSEFKVEDLPALGLPTSPIKGSRGMLGRTC